MNRPVGPPILFHASDDIDHVSLHDPDGLKGVMAEVNVPTDGDGGRCSWLFEVDERGNFSVGIRPT